MLAHSQTSVIAFMFLAVVDASTYQDEARLSAGMQEPSCTLEGMPEKRISSSLLQATIARNPKLAAVPQDQDSGEELRLPDDVVHWAQEQARRQARLQTQRGAAQLAEPSSTALNSRRLKPGSQNLCINLPGDGEYLAPEFLLIGAEKAATTTFAQLFGQSQGVVWPSNFNDSRHVKYKNPKELQIFHITERFNLGKAFWLHHYPRCSRASRLVTVDFTPSYLDDERAAGRIQSYYAEHSMLVKFGVILRNPINRMHSAFHFWKQGKGRVLCSREEVEVEFQEYVLGMLAGVDPCGLLPSGDYATQLQRYFDVFDPSQFTIFLFKQIATPKGNRSTVVRNLWQRLHLPGLDAPEPPHINVNSHPTLMEELDAHTLLALTQHPSFASGIERMAEMFTATDNMPTLAEYTGDRNTESVKTWIRQHW